jgi:hypothetical protein
MSEFIKNNKPYWLPQMTAPFDYVTKELKHEEVPYSLYNILNTELKPLQKEVNPDTVDFFKGVYKKNTNKYPIFVSADNEILDGHNRFVAHKLVRGDRPITCFKIECDSKCAARILNKIQDKFDFEKTSNNKLEPISKFLDKPEIGWFDTMKDVEFVCYRDRPIKENSESGNFFYLTSDDGSKKFKIHFDKLMYISTDSINDPNKLPQAWLAEKLAINKDFHEVALSKNISLQAAINREVAKKCREMGFDGINYGDKLIQTI